MENPPVERWDDKSPLRKEMDREDEVSKAAGCPPGHTYNEVIKKCMPGSPLSGIAGYKGALGKAEKT